MVLEDEGEKSQLPSQNVRAAEGRHEEEGQGEVKGQEGGSQDGHEHEASGDVPVQPSPS